MAELVWDSTTDRYFNAGVDRGVLYVDGKAVPWNGLISVDEKSFGGEIEPIYLDGVRIRNLSSISEYSATITAFYSPPEFDACDGIYLSQYDGFYATNQIRRPFGLSYRTGFSNDAGSVGYKIHLIYNAMAEPSSVTYSTLNNSPEATNLSWDIKAVPNFDMTQYISAHYVFDTTKVPDYVAETFEGIIYGTKKTAPRLPTSSDIQNIFVDYWNLTVTDTGNGYYEISGSDKAVEASEGYYTISSPNVTDKKSYYDIESS